jgi:hypothetical protein
MSSQIQFKAATIHIVTCKFLSSMNCYPQIFLCFWVPWWQKWNYDCKNAQHGWKIACSCAVCWKDNSSKMKTSSGNNYILWIG